MPRTMVKKKDSAKDVDDFKKALRSLKIKTSDVLSHKEYTDKIVIVTKAGQKFVVPK